MERKGPRVFWAVAQVVEPQMPFLDGKLSGHHIVERVVL